MHAFLTKIQLLLTLLLLGSVACYAQTEDTIKLRSIDLNMKQPLPVPLLQPNDQLLLPKMGVDQIEFTQKQDSKKLQNLSVECYSSLFEKAYREWEKKDYGTNLHLQKFVVKKDRKYNESPYYVPPPPPSASMSFWFKSKKEKWFDQNFKHEDRIYGLDHFVDTIGFDRAYKERVKQLVDSTLRERKLKMQKVAP